MRYINFLAGMFFITATVCMTSCKPEVCDDVVCANEGVCSGGVCQCKVGWEGVRCETLGREKFMGTYSVAEDGTLTEARNYSTNIHAADDFGIDAVRLKGFYNYFEDQVYARCKGDSLVIPEQTLSDGSTVRGYGVFTQQDYYANHGRLEIAYIVIDENGAVDDFGIDRGGRSEWSK